MGPVNQLKETIEDCQEYEVYSHDTPEKVGHKTAETEFLATKPTYYHERTNQGQNQRLTFYFDVKKCQACPLKEGCYKEWAKSKTYCVTIKSQAHSDDQQAFQETEEF